MKGKAAFVLGAAIGYVLGTRAGRERYEQIKRGAQTVWETEPVQRGVESIRSAVDVRVDEFKHTVTATGGKLLGSLANRVQGSREEAPPEAPKAKAAPSKRTSASKAAPAKSRAAAKPAAKKPSTAAKTSKTTTTDSEAS